MKLFDVMTTEVKTLNVDNTVERAARLMKKYNVGSIPVCRDGKIAGIITDRDITLRCIAHGENISCIKVGRIMSSNPITGHSNMDVREAAKLMAKYQIRRLPVVHNDIVVGIFCLGDLARLPNFLAAAGNALSSISAAAPPAAAAAPPTAAE